MAGPTADSFPVFPVVGVTREDDSDTGPASDSAPESESESAPDRIAALEDVPTDGTLFVTLRAVDADDQDGPTEAILSRLDDGTVVAYRNYCMHWTDVRLDKGEGALVRRGELVCQKHGATFQRDSGYCDFGPCEGATLERVDVTVRDGAVFLDDIAYAFVHVGPDESAVADSGSRIDFTGT
jgi:nitrite reductase/ring-hydroxylating ferredoxin subunit